MAIVTLISDFGTKDYYSGAMKGNLLSLNPGIQIIDITHEIESHNIIEAAWVLRNIHKTFPPGSFHIAYVKNHELNQPLIVFKLEHRYYIGPNNGLFSLVFDNLNSEVFEMSGQMVQSPFYHISELIHNIRTGTPLAECTAKTTKLLTRLNIQPIVQENQIRASIIHIDKYGNVIVNLDKTLFDTIRKERPFKIYFKHSDPITRISSSYADGTVGEPISIFNMHGNMVIATIMGNAAEELGLNKDETIQIIFEE